MSKTYSSGNIPAILKDYNVYKDSNKLIGQGSEMTLPSIEFLTSTIDGAGILGEIDLPSVGRTSNIEAEVPFKMISTEALSLVSSTKAVTIILRGAIEILDQSSGTLMTSGMKVTMKGFTTSVEPGTAKRGDKMDSNVKMSLIYYKIEADGTTLIEIDKLNGVCIVNGEDLMADVTKYI